MKYPEPVWSIIGRFVRDIWRLLFGPKPKISKSKNNYEQQRFLVRCFRWWLYRPWFTFCCLIAMFGWVVTGMRLLEGFQNRKDVAQSIWRYWQSGADYQMGNCQPIGEVIAEKCKKYGLCPDCKGLAGSHLPWCGILDASGNKIDSDELYMEMFYAMRSGDYVKARKLAKNLAAYLEYGGIWPQKYTRTEVKSYLNSVLRGTV
jgi:hypothetical protein